MTVAVSSELAAHQNNVNMARTLMSSEISGASMSVLHVAASSQLTAPTSLSVLLLSAQLAKPDTLWFQLRDNVAVSVLLIAVLPTERLTQSDRLGLQLRIPVTFVLVRSTHLLVLFTPSALSLLAQPLMNPAQLSSLRCLLMDVARLANERITVVMLRLITLITLKSMVAYLMSKLI